MGNDNLTNDPKDECTHKTLRFGSGDYYLICGNCLRFWSMCGDGDKADPSRSNRSAASSSLSGQERVERGS